MPDPRSIIDRYGGDYGALFNATEAARARMPDADPEIASLSPEQLVELNRYAQSADVPATALLAAPYEALKGIEQHTGLPALTGPGKALRALGAPVALPNAHTSPARLQNVTASLRGAGAGLEGWLRGLGLK